jgi:hypothetical protein
MGCFCARVEVGWWGVIDNRTEASLPKLPESTGRKWPKPPVLAREVALLRVLDSEVPEFRFSPKIFDRSLFHRPKFGVKEILPVFFTCHFRESGET